MTTYNKSAAATQGSGSSTTQNVIDNDTVVFTVTNSNVSSFNISVNNCTSNKTSMSSGQNCTISFSGTGTYTVTVGGFSGGKEPDYYVAVLTGTVTASATQYTVTSGIISLGGVRTFLGDSGSIALGDLYKGGSLVPNISQNTGHPTSGEIDLADLYGVWKN